MATFTNIEQGNETSSMGVDSKRSSSIPTVFDDEFVEEPDGIDGKSTKFQAIFNFIKNNIKKINTE